MRLTVSCAQCFMGTEENPEAGKVLNYADDKLSQVCEETVSCFRHLTKDKNVCSDTRKSYIRCEIDLILYLFGHSYHNRYSAPQSVSGTFRITAEIEEIS